MFRFIEKLNIYHFCTRITIILFSYGEYRTAKWERGNGRYCFKWRLLYLHIDVYNLINRNLTPSLPQFPCSTKVRPCPEKRSVHFSKRNPLCGADSHAPRVYV